MQFTSDICFMCLKKDSTIKDIKNDVKYSIEIINFVLPELINKEFGLPLICSHCFDICKVFHKFKRICIENYGRWKDYILQSQKTDLFNADIVIKTEFFEEEINPLETYIKLEKVDYSEENTESNVSDVCKFGDKDFINNENQNFQISSIISNADNYLQNLETKYEENHEVNSLLVIKEKPNKNNKKSPVQCSICNKNFKSRHYLKLHKKSHNIKVKHECPHCNKLFKHNYVLSRHLKTHLDTKQHECSVCNKKFHLKHILNYHMKSHTGNEIKCKICRKVFQQERYLKKHMKIHSKDKEHKCSHCKKEFLYSRDLKKHIKTKHSD